LESKFWEPLYTVFKIDPKTGVEALAARAWLSIRAARSARISACAAARSEGSESNVSVTSEGNHSRVDL